MKVLSTEKATGRMLGAARKLCGLSKEDVVEEFDAMTIDTLSRIEAGELGVERPKLVHLLKQFYSKRGASLNNECNIILVGLVYYTPEDVGLEGG